MGPRGGHSLRQTLCKLCCSPRATVRRGRHPVLGDDKYGDRDFNKLRKKRTQQLLAKRLEIDGRVFESLRELGL